MIISSEIKKTLEKTDGSAYEFRFIKETERCSKQEYLIKFFKNNRGSILDVGCCGHKKNIDRQIQEGKWLHGRLSEIMVPNVVCGVDINEENVKYLKEMYNVKNLWCADVTKDLEKIKKESGINGMFSWVLCADVIEHTTDPIGFLKAIKASNTCERIVITVPNMFHFVNLAIAYRDNAETINSDHKYWFSPYTLLKCCFEAGIDVEEIDIVDYKVKGHMLPRFMDKDIMGATIVCVGRM